MARKPTGRRPGAPLNNINHLKHGIYSHHISVKDDEELGMMSRNGTFDELDLARTRIHRCLERQGSVPEQEWITYELAVSHYLGQVIAMIHKNASYGGDKKAALKTIMDCIRQENEIQHVR